MNSQTIQIKKQNQNKISKLRHEQRKLSSSKQGSQVEYNNRNLSEMLNNKQNIQQKITSNLVKDHLKIRSTYDKQIEDLNETLQRLAREKAAHLKRQHKK